MARQPNGDEPAAPFRHYLLAALACAATTLIATPLLSWFDPTNIVMLFLLTVLLVALRFGRGPAVMAAFLSVALFDVFFVPPRYSFTVADSQYLLTFAVMLAVALTTAHLVATLRRQAESERGRERRTRALYEMARTLAGAVDRSSVAEVVGRFLAGLAIRSTLLVAEDGALKPIGNAPAVPRPAWLDDQLARMAFARGQTVEFKALSEADYSAYYFPLRGPSGTDGVLLLEPEHDDDALIRDNRELLEAVASLAGIAMERVHHAEAAQAAELRVTSERLRGSVLSALSHDLRTPLTALVGLADSLALARPPLPPPQQETAGALRDQALRINGLVANLLDMARLQAGALTPRREWQPLEEVVGASLKLLERGLAGRPVHVALAPDLPMLEFDAVLIERVLCNLLENAAKYSPSGTPIDIEARRDGAVAAIAVCDRGPGVEPARRQSLLDMFERGAHESAVPGVGLGLAICRAIVEAHGGRIAVEDREGGGACFRFTLPLGEPPAVDLEAGAADKGNAHG